MTHGKIFFLLAAFTVSSAASTAPVPPVSRGLAVVHSDVFNPSDGRISADQTVLVSGGRISAVGPTKRTPVPRGYAVINGRGKTLLPGLVDMHVHLANEPGIAGDAAQRALAVMLTYGVTTVRSMAGGNKHIALRSAVERGLIPGPRVYAASPALNDRTIKTASEGAAAVNRAKQEGFDLIKSHNLPDPAVWQAIENEAHRVGLPVSGHVTNEVGLTRALREKEQIEHLDGLIAELLPPGKRIGFEQFPPPEILAELDGVSDEALRQLAARVKSAGNVQDPTLNIFERLTDLDIGVDRLRGQPTMRFVAPQVVESWVKQHEEMAQSGLSAIDAERLARIRRRIVSALNSAGVPIMAGSDTAQSFQIWGDGLIGEMTALSRAGLGNKGALRSATIVPRDYLRGLANGGSSFGWRADFGTVEPGARADLILVRSSPIRSLEVLKQPDWVIAGGRAYNRRMLLSLRARAARDAQTYRPQPASAATHP